MNWIVRHEKKHLIRLRDGNNSSLIFNSDISSSMANFLFHKTSIKATENKNGLISQILSQKIENFRSNFSTLSNLKSNTTSKRNKHRYCFNLKY